MIAMPSLAAIRIGALIATVAAAGLAGWTARGWQADAAIASLRNTIAQGVASAAIEARRIERNEQEVVNHALRTQNDSLAGIAARLRTDLERLRNRPERPVSTAGMPAAPRTGCAGASGLELARGNAEFLIRFAALAAEQDAALIACYAVADAEISGP